jgi:hypothetical protein
MMGTVGEYGLEPTYEVVTKKRMEQMEQSIRNN